MHAQRILKLFISIIHAPPECLINEVKSHSASTVRMYIGRLEVFGLVTSLLNSSDR